MSNLNIPTWESSLQMISDSMETHNAMHVDSVFADVHYYELCYKIFKDIRHHVVCILDAMRCNKLLNVSNLNEKINKIRQKLPSKWSFKETGVTYFEVAECICVTDAPKQTIKQIQNLITDRKHSAGFVYEPAEDDEPTYILESSLAEMWLLLALFSDRKLDCDIALHNAKTFYKDASFNHLKQHLQDLNAGASERIEHNDS